MARTKSYVEAVLLEELFSAALLEDTLGGARELGFTVLSLDMVPVVHSSTTTTKEGEIPSLPVIYLQKLDTVPFRQALIVKGPDDDMYRIHQYRLIE
jgi:hypothetical protein